MSAFAARAWRCSRGSTAAEFALVLPLLLLFLLGMVDVGRFMWEVNRAEKATQMGARMAIVTDPVSAGLVEADFASGSLPPGELIPRDAIGVLVCDAQDCECTDCPTAIDGTVNSDAFDAIVARMAQFKPDITADDVEISYRGSGFGYAASPTSGGGASAPPEAMEISPLVTVALKNVAFEPLFLFGRAGIAMPSFATTMTAEDSAGSFSN